MSSILLMLVIGVAQAADHAVLFVGNSYTFFNAPNSIDGSYAQLVAEGLPAWEVNSLSYAKPAYTLPQHLADAGGDTELHDWLTGADGASFDIVVLQDQSQIPAFPREQAEWGDSKDAAVDLAEMIVAAGAEPKLFMTWGYREGDASNAWRFPDYPTMQGLLASGYYAYAEAIVTSGFPVEVVPVGMAWQTIYDDHSAVGEDPLDPEARFSRLYAADGSHPSVLGTYMASLIFYAAFTGQSPVGLLWAPDEVSEEDRDALQAVAERVMVDAIGGGGDTDSPGDGDDTGSTSGGGGGGETVDSGLEEEGGPDAESQDTAAASTKDGCGCAAGGGVGPAWIGLLLLGLRRRRSAEM